MLHENHLRYFFSIQPFWDMGRMENFIRSDHISVSEFRWIHDVMSCVPAPEAGRFKMKTETF